MSAPRFRLCSWRSGEVQIVRGRTPAGSIAMFTFHSLRAAAVASRIIDVRARHAYDGETLLVPGVPEADNDDAACDALIAWCERINEDFLRRIPARLFKFARAA